MANYERTIKVTHGEETRRGRLNLSEDATAVDVYSIIRSTVATLFGTAEERLVLRYEDEEGDLCTLTEHTVQDLLTISPTGVLRLTMNLRDGSLAKDTDEPDASTQDVPVSTADAQTADGEDSAVRHKIRSFLEKMPPGPLSAALAFAQSMDPAAMHAWLPIATHFMAQGGGPTDARAQQARDVIAELQQLEPAALKALVISELSSACETKSSGEAAQGNAPPENPLGAMLGPFLAASQVHGNAQHNPLEQMMRAAMGCKGVGKGEATQGNAPPQNPLEMMLGPFLAASQMHGHAQQNPLEQMMGAAMGCKGAGKSDGSFNPPGVNPFEILGQVLGGKGKGKGNDMSPKPAPETTTSAPSAGTSRPDSAEEMASSAERNAFDESVDDLLNMGLVSDRQVARELLTKYGDVSSVVSALTEE